MAEAIKVRGLRDLQRAFSVADRTLNRELRDGLREASEPVRSEAERLAVVSIPRVGIPWSRMRVGITRKLVYVAPRERGSPGTSHGRPNFAALLMERAMQPALDRNINQVEDKLERVLDTVGKDWERA